MKITLRQEKNIPLLFALMLTVLLSSLIYCLNFDFNKSNIYVSTITLGIVMAGFSATQLSMLIGINESKLMSVAKQSGYIEIIITLRFYLCLL